MCYLLGFLLEQNLKALYKLILGYNKIESPEHRSSEILRQYEHV